MPGCSAQINCQATAHCLNFTVIGRDLNFLHNPKIKRRFLKVDKSKYERMVDGKSSHKAYAEMLDENMEAGDPEPSIVPGPNQLRIIKQYTDRPRG